MLRSNPRTYAQPPWAKVGAEGSSFLAPPFLFIIIGVGLPRERVFIYHTAYYLAAVINLI